MNRVSHFKVGLFILASLGFGFAALIWIGAAHFFRHSKPYVAFFNESVEGLMPGAKVSYLGVGVGSVTTIGLAPDGRLIRVTMALKPTFKVDDMAVQLGLQGITGQRYLQIGPAPKNIDKLAPKIGFPTRLPVIPSQPGEMTRIEQALEKTYKEISATDIGGLVQEWKKTGRDADALLTSGDLRRTLANVHRVSADLKTLLAPLQEKGTPEQWRKGFRNLSATAEDARKASQALAAQLEKLPPNTVAHLAKQMTQMATSGEKAVGNMNRQVARSLTLLRQNLVQVNQLLMEMTQLMQTLRQEPGRILNRPRSSEPFGR